MGRTTLRIVAVAGLLLLLVLAAAAAWLGHNLDRLVRDALVRYGSEVLQAPVSVGEVSIRLLDGQGEIRHLIIGNPRGFRMPQALQVEHVALSIDPWSLLDPVVRVRRLAVLAPTVTIEQGARRSNLETLRDNAERKVAGQGASATATGARKLVIETFSLTRARVEAGVALPGVKTLSATLPDVQLRDIGQARGGATPAEVGQTILRAITERLTLGRAAESLGRAVNESVSRSVDKAARKVEGLFR